MRPDYEALDANGFPYIRKARIIGELPNAKDRLQALSTATPKVAAALGIKAKKTINFGTPVHMAFGLTRQQAKHHALSALLLTTGENLSLDFVFGPVAEPVPVAV